MSTLMSILSLLPSILMAVQAVEAAVPVQGAGKAKLDLVIGTISTVYSADQALQKAIPNDQLVAIVGGTVSNIVTTFNTLGLFKKAK